MRGHVFGLVRIRELWFGMNVEHMGAMDWCVHVSGCLFLNEQRLNEMVTAKVIMLENYNLLGGFPGFVD